MVVSKKLQQLNEYFLKISDRAEKGVYFYRINGYSPEVEQFIARYYETARLHGVVIEGKIPNPEDRHLAFYQEMMGGDFTMSLSFLQAGLAKWLPRMGVLQRGKVAESMYGCLEQLQQQGKNENMLRNAYIKFMCWLYYKFERIVNQLGGNEAPKILYEGTVSTYELMMLSILSHAGCDIVLLQYEGDAGYRKLDPDSTESKEYPVAGATGFPAGFSVRQLRERKMEEEQQQRRLGQEPARKPCTNAWMKGNVFEDLLLPANLRGEDENFFYNCLVRIVGVEDKLTYANELFQLHLKLENSGRNIVIVEGQIPTPTVEEIGAVRRGNYADIDQMITGLSSNLVHAANLELERLMRYAFALALTEEAKKPGMNVNRLMNKAVYLLCWIKRYQSLLFANWKESQVACFIYLGGCKSENESLFLHYLVNLPVDVLLLVPDRNQTCCFTDSMLFEKKYGDSLCMEHFPSQAGNMQMGTAAYHAERELDSMLYQDSGIYRDRQFDKANTIPLQTMYEEISILWDQELKYRPNFSTNGDTVNMPVLFAKVSGVKDADVGTYWSTIKSLITENATVVAERPLVNSNDYNPIKGAATSFYKNGRLQRTLIKSHPAYEYSFLREETQDYILDKLQLMLEQKRIKGMGQNGTEYTVIGTILHLPQDLLRKIQQFDFTKKNPKLLYINTTERIITLEDAIICAFLHLIGFDVVFFVPNGYQTVENHYTEKIMEEYQIGDYMYDLVIPDFHKVSTTRQSWREKIFKRGSRNGFRF